MKFKPLKQPITVYLRTIDNAGDGDEVTSTRHVWTSTSRPDAPTAGGDVASLDLPIGTLISPGGNDGDVILKRGLTFRVVNRNALQLVSPEELRWRELLSFMEIGSDPPPPLPETLSEFLDQIEYLGPVPNWEEAPDADYDPEDDPSTERMIDDPDGSKGQAIFEEWQASVAAEMAGKANLVRSSAKKGLSKQLPPTMPPLRFAKSRKR